VIVAGTRAAGLGTISGRVRSVLVIDQVDGRSRSAVAAVRALAAGGFRPLVAVSGRRSSAAVSRDCAGTVLLPPPGVPDYRQVVLHELAAGGLRPLVTSDAALVALGLPGGELVDKAFLPHRAAAAGLAMPQTRGFADAAELREAAGSLDYPLVLKPAFNTAAAAGARRVDSAQALHEMTVGLPGPVVVQPFHDGGLTAVAGVIRDGSLLAVVHQAYVRFWPPECGVASAAVTTPPNLELEARLPRLLAGHCGVFQVQFVGDLLIDVNPRAYGSLPLAVAAGANLPAIACTDPPTDRDGPVRGRPGVRYRWLEGDVRRVLHDVRHGRLEWKRGVTAMRPRRGTAHSIESLRDPLPGLVRLTDVLRRS